MRSSFLPSSRRCGPACACPGFVPLAPLTWKSNPMIHMFRFSLSLLRLALVPSFLLISAVLRAEQYDVVVYGGTPGGIAAAVTAARQGHSVALVESHRHLGGMAASGLGKSDVETREAIGGLWQEFVRRVRDYYVRKYGPNDENVKLCRDGYYYEPSVAEAVFSGMIGEQSRIRVSLDCELQSAERNDKRLVAIHCREAGGDRPVEFRARVFIDASYEGDLAAYAGVGYRVGREGRADYNELHAGVIYMDNRSHTILAGSTGEGDRRVQAYTFRLCLTRDPANRVVPSSPPPEYDRERYAGYLDDVKAGRMAARGPISPTSAVYEPFYNTIGRVFTAAALPNGKYDANMYAIGLGYPFAELNYGYPEADPDQRRRITEHIRNVTLGLLYFIQNDPEIPEEQRALTREFGLAKDEFKDNGNFPWQLYVREARRIEGEYTLTENDLIVGPELGRTRLHPDSIAAGEYPIDSMPVRRREPGHEALEGYIMMLKEYTNPYQIPYGVIVPKSIDGLLVPVAASTTHIAFSSIRLEPTWMALGQAAATAAHVAMRDDVDVRDVDINEVQAELLAQGQVLTYFRDIDHSDPAYAALQYFGTKGFFRDYLARSSEPVTRETCRRWLELALGDTGGKIGASLTGEGALTAGDVAALGRRAGWTGVELPGGIAAGVSRGQLCRVLYAVVRADGASRPKEAR